MWQFATIAAVAHSEPERRVVDPVLAILGTDRAAALHPATISAQTCLKSRTLGFPDLRFSWDEPNEKLITVAERIAETTVVAERPGHLAFARRPCALSVSHVASRQQSEVTPSRPAGSIVHLRASRPDAGLGMTKRTLV
jgi:hypothetical protein